MSDADIKLDIGRQLTRGSRRRQQPRSRSTSREDHLEEIEEVLKGADMVFITAGEGGGTGTGAAPVVAEVAKTSARSRSASSLDRSLSKAAVDRSRPTPGFVKLKEKVDTLIIIPNDALSPSVIRRPRSSTLSGQRTRCSFMACRGSPTHQRSRTRSTPTSPT